MKIKRTEVLQLNNVLLGLSRVQNTQFAYAVVRNKRCIRDIVESLTDARQAPEGYEEYENQRKKIILEHAQKDLGGDPIMLQNGDVKIEDDAKFEEAYLALRSSFKDVLDLVEQKERDLKELFEGEEDISHYPINVKFLPKDLNLHEMEALLPLIEGDMDQIYQD